VGGGGEELDRVWGGTTKDLIGKKGSEGTSNPPGCGNEEKGGKAECPWWMREKGRKEKNASE